MVLLSEITPVRLGGKQSTFRSAQHDINDHLEKMLMDFATESARADAAGAEDFKAGRYHSLDEVKAMIYGG